MSAYPHPVLTPNTDDINGDTSFKYEFLNNVLYIKAIKIDNQYIKKLIDDGKAVFCLIFENNSIMFNHTIKTSEYDITVPIEKNTYPNGKYSVELIIVANDKIDNFSSNTFHEDYNNTEFTLEPGSIISNLGYFDFTVRKDYHEIGEKEDIFEFHSMDDPENKGNIRLWVQGGKIYIGYHKEDRISIIQKLMDNSRYAMLQGYIVPALVWAIENLGKNYRDNYSELWATVIINLMIKHDLIDNGTEDEVKDAIESLTSVFIANKILDHPLIGLKNSI